MASGDICTANMGTPWSLAYGFFRATGMRKINYSVPAADETPQPADMQLGVWDLGEGELDGCNALWINDELQFAYDSTGLPMGPNLVGQPSSNIATTPALSSFSFHTGCDAPLGSGGGVSQTEQLVDPILDLIGSLITPLCWSRRAYYTIAWTPASDDNSEMSPVADFRGMRCRIFDGNGDYIAYKFTTNPIWHFVDLWLRRAIKPEYAIPQGGRPDALTADESARFNWPSIFAAAQYCDELLANGLPRFSGSYVFASGSTLAAMLEQVLLCCRGYWYEYAGQIYVFIDQPRASTFLATADHLASASLEADQSQVDQNANRYIAEFLELGLPAVAAINTITETPASGSTAASVVIITEHDSPCAVGDVISVGGVNPSTLDAAYSVTATPSSNPLEVDCSVANGTALSGTGGSIGYIQSRFSQRTPEINHIQHQMALGQILPPNVTGTRLKRVKVSYNYANMTIDQALRLLQYEVYRDLGIDWLNPNLLQQVYGNTDLLGSPYQPPWQFTLSFYSESVDSSMRALKAQQVGDVITLDPSILFELAGDYEIIAKNVSHFQQEVEDTTTGSFITPVSRQAAMNNGTDQGSGVLQLTLRTFNRSAAIFTDAPVAANSSFATVPGQLPYAGSSAYGAGWALSSNSLFTISTPWTGSFTDYLISTASWTEIVITLAGGKQLTYPAGVKNHISCDPTIDSWTFYINDPSLTGGITPSVDAEGPTPGTGVFVLLSFTVPLPVKNETNVDSFNL
ncbi:MAG: hypothetical protein ACLQG3_14710 [Terracidiphilus sp.]